MATNNAKLYIPIGFTIFFFLGMGRIIYLIIMTRYKATEEIVREIPPATQVRSSVVVTTTTVQNLSATRENPYSRDYYFDYNEQSSRNAPLCLSPGAPHYISPPHMSPGAPPPAYFVSHDYR